MDANQWTRAFQTDHYAIVGQRVLGQLIEAILYEEIALPEGGLPAPGFVGELVMHGMDRDGLPVAYKFNGKRKFTFGRIRLDRGSVRRVTAAEEPQEARLATFVEEVLGQVKGKERLAVLLDELENTLVKDTQAQYWRSTVPALSGTLGYDELESRLDGHPYHPCYKSRVGFSLADNALYGPEFNQDLQPVWVAVATSHSLVSQLRGVDYESAVREELGEEVYASFDAVLNGKGLEPAAYRFMPVHPWQWEHIVAPAFHRLLADGTLVYLGRGSDVYRAQQSIRSWANVSDKRKAYVKMAMGMTNTSTKRVLAKHTVMNAPLVSDWLLALTENDETARKLDVVFLAEYAGVTFDYDTLPSSLTHARAFSQLGAVWRRSIHRYLRDEEQAVPFHALSHSEGGRPVINEWVQAYGTEAWARRLLQVAVTPIIHMLYAHGLAMESHAQNMILIHRDGLPCRIALKDFHDGLRFSKAHLPQPEACPELHLEPAQHRAMNRHSFMQTDDLDAVKDFVHSAFFFVCLGDLALFLDERYGFDERAFWQIVAETIERYQQEHPQHADNFARYDLFSHTIRIEQLARRRLWKDTEVEPKHVPNPLSAYRAVLGGKA